MLQEDAIGPGTLELLRKLQSDPALDMFHLAGGTGLALYLGHRLSNDIDLFSETDFDILYYSEYLVSKCGFIIDFSAPGTLKGSIRSIKSDFIKHSYKRIEQLTLEAGLRIYSIPDIAAMKLNAIAGSGTGSKDFIDLYFLLRIYSVEKLVQFYEAKYSDRNVLHLIKSLNYFEDVDLSDWPIIIKEKDISWEKVKKTIDEHCRNYIKKLK